MSIMAGLLDAYRKAQNLSSDNALSAELGVTRQTVSQYRNGSAYPDQERFISICDGAGLDAGAWLAAMQAERASGDTRARWLEAAKKLGYAAAIILAVYTAIPQSAVAANASRSASALPCPSVGNSRMAVYYVNLLKRFGDAFSQLARALLHHRPCYG